MGVPATVGTHGGHGGDHAGDQAGDHAGHHHPHAQGAQPPHPHHHSHAGLADRAGTRALTVTLVLTLAYFVVEVAAAFWSGSLSLLADAGHMITDAGALALSLAAARIALRPRSAKNTYGYRRAEVIGALVNSSAMLVISLVIIVEALQRIHEPQPIRGQGMLLTACCGLLVNLIAGFLLARAGGENLNVRSAFLHVAGDALGSLAAIVASLCILWFGFALADSLASILIAVVLIVGSLRLLREAAEVLMEGTPAGIDPALLTRTIMETPGVQAVHDLHIWCLTPSEPMLTAHVVLTAAAHGTDVAKRVGERLHSLHGVDHVTIQPEAPEHELVPLRSRKKP